METPAPVSYNHSAGVIHLCSAGMGALRITASASKLSMRPDRSSVSILQTRSRARPGAAASAPKGRTVLRVSVSPRHAQCTRVQSRHLHPSPAVRETACTLRCVMKVTPAVASCSAHGLTMSSPTGPLHHRTSKSACFEQR